MKLLKLVAAPLVMGLLAIASINIFSAGQETCYYVLDNEEPDVWTEAHDIILDLPDECDILDVIYKGDRFEIILNEDRYVVKYYTLHSEGWSLAEKKVYSKTEDGAQGVVEYVWMIFTMN